jgi:hypothetical protein
VAPDEGHGFARPVNDMAAFSAAERFLAAHLTGRFQEGASPDVAARLEEITVDPKAVIPQKRTMPRREAVEHVAAHAGRDDQRGAAETAAQWPASTSRRSAAGSKAASSNRIRG